MERREIVVIGTSAGGSDALRTLLAGLPADFPAAIFVVWHVPPQSPGVLPQILLPYTSLPVANARDGQAIELGHIYTAPPDRHLLLEPGYMRLTRGPKENRFRPAIDPLFRSAAYTYGPAVIGVVLTGALDDGTSGLWAVKDRGGIAVVQDPIEAEVPSMPRSAIQNVDVDHVVSLVEMAPLLTRLVSEPFEAPARPGAARLATDVRGATMARHDSSEMEILGEASEFACPECHGVLWRVPEGNILRFRCRTGHAYTANALLAELNESVEGGLWRVVRGLEEMASLLENIGKHMGQHGDAASATTFQTESAEAVRRAQAVRSLLLEGDVPGTES